LKETVETIERMMVAEERRKEPVVSRDQRRVLVVEYLV
jgi:hypothetical protein